MIDKIKRWLNYLYYRSYSFYNKYKDDDPKFMSILIVSVFEILIVILVFTLINHLLEIGRNSKQDLKMLKFAAGLLFFLLIFLNHKVYTKESIVAFKKKWDLEDMKKRRRNGWLIVALLLIPLATIILYSYLRNNLGLI